MGPYDVARNLIPDGEDSMMDSTFSTASEQTPHAKSLRNAVPGRQSGALPGLSKMMMGLISRDEGRARQPSRKFAILRSSQRFLNVDQLFLATSVDPQGTRFITLCSTLPIEKASPSPEGQSSSLRFVEVSDSSMG